MLANAISTNSYEYYQKDIFEKYDIRTVTMGAADIFKDGHYLLWSIILADF